MQEIIDFLEEKNQCLEKFYSLNEVELLNFTEGNFDHLETFYQSREFLLELIQKIDFKIEEFNSCNLSQPNITNTQRRLVLESISYKNNLVTRILAQDLQILSIIEKTKSGIIKELSSVKVARKAMQGYHSGGGSGHLDEKV